jgi:hypothetical protein
MILKQVIPHVAAHIPMWLAARGFLEIRFERLEAFRGLISC